MVGLYNHHDHEVGSQVRSGHPDKQATDCITYVINVLKYAYESVGRKNVARQVGSLGAYGTKLAKYLQGLGWVGVYWNPDTNHPRDGDVEHPYAYGKAAKLRVYYGIRVDHFAIDFNPTSASDPNYKTFANRSKEPTPLNLDGYNTLKTVKFGYGVARGGKHTFLFSEGYVYEVHWEVVGPEGLYERTELRDWDWLDGMIMVPPDNGVYR